MQAGDSKELTAFVAHMGADKALRIEENLGQGFVRLRVAEAERRQAKHDIRCCEDIVIEMLRNARDAGARKVFLATSREADRRTLTVLDDGSGIPDELRDRIFDARVTSKLESVHMDRWGVHGRGMALYSIRENTLEARVADSLVGGGASITVTTDTTSLPEKSDQSSWPQMGIGEDGAREIVRGPHNIIRTCCEFALEERGTCEVFIGSAAEVVATARSRIRPSLSASELLFVDDLSTLPVLERFAVASDASELCEVAGKLGLDISERTAHRIISGQIRPLRSVVSRLTHTASSPQPRTVDLAADRRGLRLSTDDADEFVRRLERDFSFLADRYYLTLTDTPRIRISGNRLTVSFVYEGED